MAPQTPSNKLKLSKSACTQRTRERTESEVTGDESAGIGAGRQACRRIRYTLANAPAAYQAVEY